MHSGLFAPEATLGAFLLAFPALFSVVNPFGAALIFAEVTADRSRAERLRIAQRVAFYALLVLLCSLWAGSYVLNFFGISLGALRIAGGIVVAFAGWRLLFKTEEHHADRAGQAAPSTEAEDPSFFPLTIPFTTGPGAISVAIAIASERPPRQETLHFFLGLSLAGFGVALTVWIAYRFAEQLTRMLGPTGARIASRLIALSSVEHRRADRQHRRHGAAAPAASVERRLMPTPRYAESAAPTALQFPQPFEHRRR